MQKSQSMSQPSIQKEASIQAQLEANDVPEFANEPGPGHYFGPENQGFSSFGNQKFAKCASAPEIQFPRTGWDGWRKVIISKGHEGAYKLRDSPGCVYEMPHSSLGDKATSFPKSLRPDLSSVFGMHKGSPGPDQYNVRESQDPFPQMGKGRNKAPMDSKSERFESRAHKGPGPYSRKDVALNMGTGRSFGCPRSCYDKVVRPGWEKDGQCKTSAKIGKDGSIWTDISKEGSGAFSIGRAERFPKDRVAAESPGPGQYKRDERDVSKCKSLCSDCRNPSGAPFGRRMPRKPRFRQILAITTAERGGWGYF